MYFIVFILKHLIIIKSVSRTKACKTSNTTNASRKPSSKYVTTYSEELENNLPIKSHKTPEDLLFLKFKRALHFSCNVVQLEN